MKLKFKTQAYQREAVVACFEGQRVGFGAFCSLAALCTFLGLSDLSLHGPSTKMSPPLVVHLSYRQPACSSYKIHR
jgi:hypothetical protein